jgi:hypothetical protein
VTSFQEENRIPGRFPAQWILLFWGWRLRRQGVGYQEKNKDYTHKKFCLVRETFMANPEHVAKLEDAEIWNAWRRKNLEVNGDLRKADLSKEKRTGVGEPNIVSLRILSATPRHFPVSGDPKLAATSEQIHCYLRSSARTLRVMPVNTTVVI